VAFARNLEDLGLRVTTIWSDRKRLFARRELIDTALESGCETGRYRLLPVSIYYLRTRRGIGHLLSRDHEYGVRPTHHLALENKPQTSVHSTLMIMRSLYVVSAIISLSTLTLGVSATTRKYDFKIEQKVVSPDGQEHHY